MAALLGYGLVAKGGFYLHNAAVLAVAVTATAVVAAVRHPVFERSDRPALVAFAMLACALAASSAADGWSPRGMLPALTLVVAFGTYLSARAAVRAGHGDALIEVLAWAGALSGLACCLALAFHVRPLALPATGLWRAAGTVTYANAAAAFLALCAPAALRLARSRPGAGQLMLYVLLAGVAATASRGAVLAILVGGGCMFALRRSALRDALRPCLGACIAFAGLVPAMLSSDPQPVAALGGLLVGGLLAAAPLPAVARRTLAVLVLAAIAAAAALTFQRWIPLVESRLGGGSEVRLATWEYAVQQGLGAPVLGAGPGTFHSPGTRFAHNEYLQVFAETGAVGLTTVLLAMFLLALMVWRARSQPDWAYGAAACAGFAAHSSIDFLWRFPVLVMVAFVWFATSTALDAQMREEADG